MVRTWLTLVMLLALAAGAQAVEPWENWLSLIWDPLATPYDADCLYQAVDETIVLTLWLVRPVNPDFDQGEERPVTGVAAFDCRVTFSDGLDLLGWSTPVPATVVSNLSGLRVTYAEPLPVVDGRAALAYCEVHVGAPPGVELPEGPVPRCSAHVNAWTTVTAAVPAALPGEVSYTDADDPVDPLVVPHCTDGTDLKFEIHQGGVPAAGPAWSAVKALYR